MRVAAENRPRHGAADRRRRDVVEERRQHEDHDKRDQAAVPVIGQVVRQLGRYPALLEVPGQEGKAEQQTEHRSDRQKQELFVNIPPHLLSLQKRSNGKAQNAESRPHDPT